MTVDPIEGVTSNSTTTPTGEVAPAPRWTASRGGAVAMCELADRLHNMRTLRFVKDEEKRRRIARETIDIFAPIAHRLGLNQMYRELQDLSFRFLNPWRYGALAKALERARGTRRAERGGP